MRTGMLIMKDAPDLLPDSEPPVPTPPDPLPEPPPTDPLPPDPVPPPDPTPTPVPPGSTPLPVPPLIISQAASPERIVAGSRGRTT